jgi:hypothetical protein
MLVPPGGCGAVIFIFWSRDNPVKYTDPDGKLIGDITNREKQYAREILGDFGSMVVQGTKVFMIPGERSASTPLFHFRQLWLSSDIFESPLNTGEGQNKFIHELFHQIQYSFRPGPMLLGDSAFEDLIGERVDELNGIAVYAAGNFRKTDLNIYNSLKDMPFLESQAQMVGDFAELYSHAKAGNKLNDNQAKAIKQMAKILTNSGIRSEAIKWVDKNF